MRHSKRSLWFASELLVLSTVLAGLLALVWLLIQTL